MTAQSRNKFPPLKRHCFFRFAFIELSSAGSRSTKTSIDNGVDVDEVEKWLPVLRFIARYLLVEAFPKLFQVA
jgi:hypothetical protein